MFDQQYTIREMSKMSTKASTPKVSEKYVFGILMIFNEKDYKFSFYCHCYLKFFQDR